MNKADVFSKFHGETPECRGVLGKSFDQEKDFSWLPEFFKIPEGLHDLSMQLLMEKISTPSYQPTPKDLTDLWVKDWLSPKIADKFMQRVVKEQPAAFVDGLSDDTLSQWVGALFEDWTSSNDPTNMALLLKSIPAHRHPCLSQTCALSFALGMEYGRDDMAKVIAEHVPYMIEERLAGVVCAIQETHDAFADFDALGLKAKILNSAINRMNEIQLKVIHTLEDVLTDQQCFFLWDKISTYVDLPESIRARGLKMDLLSRVPSSLKSAPIKKI